MGKVNPIAESCFATEIRGSIRHILGKKTEPHGIEERASPNKL